MERRLNLTPPLNFHDNDDVKVAATTMAFENAKIINMLIERGNYIKSEQWDKQAEIEKKINDVKDSEFKSIVVPCSVFMTFETQEGQERAKALKSAIEKDKKLSHLKFWLGNHQIEIK